MEESNDPKMLKAKESSAEFRDTHGEKYSDPGPDDSEKYDPLEPTAEEIAAHKSNEETEEDVQRWLEELEKEDPVLVEAPPRSADTMDISSIIGQSEEMGNMVNLLRVVGVSPIVAQRVATNLVKPRRDKIRLAKKSSL